MAGEETSQRPLQTALKVTRKGIRLETCHQEEVLTVRDEAVDGEEALGGLADDRHGRDRVKEVGRVIELEGSAEGEDLHEVSHDPHQDRDFALALLRQVHAE